MLTSIRKFKEQGTMSNAHAVFYLPMAKFIVLRTPVVTDVRLVFNRQYLNIVI